MKKWIIYLASLALAGSALAAEKEAKAEDSAGFTTSLNAGLTMPDRNSETLAANIGCMGKGGRIER